MNRTGIILAVILLAALAIRSAGLATVPPALNSDELLKVFDGAAVYRTGMDHHGHSWPLFFKQTGEYSPPFYIYFAGLFSAQWGINGYTTRLPSAVLGILSVLLTFFYVRDLWGENAGLLAAFLVAFSPWNAHYSRMGWEAISAIPMQLVGLWLFLRWSRSLSAWNLVFSSACFALTFYTYPTARVFIPMLLLGLVGLHYRELLRHWRHTVSALIVFFLLVLPYIWALAVNYKLMQARWIFLSVFQQDNGLWLMIQHYLLHLSPMFLFVTGDANPLHMMAGGLALLVLLPFFYIGLVQLFRRWNRETGILAIWFFLFAIPSSMTYDRYDIHSMPNALRSSCGMPLLEIISIYGIIETLRWVSTEATRRWIAGAFGVALGINIIVIGYDYTFRYPIYSAPAFQYGLEEAVQFVEANKEKYDRIIVSPNARLHPVSLAVFSQRAPGPFSGADFPKYVLPFYTYIPIYRDFQFEEYHRYQNIVQWYTQAEGRNLLLVKGKEITVGTPLVQFKNPDGSVAYEVYEAVR